MERVAGRAAMRAFDAGRREHVRHPRPAIAPLMPYLAMFLLILVAGLLATCFF
jgi:hypothetical protein